MADVEPFQAWRYDLAQVGALADVVAPPYDVIDAEAQTELYERHPCNVIRLILNRSEPGDNGVDDRYERARTFLQHWQSEGVMRKDPDAGFYVHHQEFEWEGSRYLRKGFLGRLRLEAFGEGDVYPHEETMSGPKADRLKLVSATQTNLSPIFGLFPDSDEAAQSLLEGATTGLTPLEITDEHGVTHRLWHVTDSDVVGQVRSLMADKAIYIADGHHRYETALNYRNQLRESGELDNDVHPANYVMMMFVGMSDPGLAILPTHRLIQGLPALDEAALRTALGSHVEFTVFGDSDTAATEAWEHVQMDGAQSTFGFGLPDGTWLTGKVNDPTLLKELASEHSDEWRDLGVSILHRLIIDHLLTSTYPEASISARYVHLMDEVTSSLSAGECSLAVLVNPATIEHVELIASNQEKMPPKSTFFYPKLLSGLTLHELR